MQQLHPDRTTWHITFGTYGTRLHGSQRPTVERKQNRFGEAFVRDDTARENSERQRMVTHAVRFTSEQRRFVEQVLPQICDRGGWLLRTCAAGRDHIHLLCDVVYTVHGKQVRKLIKRWLTQALHRRWPHAAERSWWAEGGSNKAIKDADYLNDACEYIERQRLSRAIGEVRFAESDRAEDRPAHEQR